MFAFQLEQRYSALLTTSFEVSAPTVYKTDAATFSAGGGGKKGGGGGKKGGGGEKDRLPDISRLAELSDKEADELLQRFTLALINLWRGLLERDEDERADAIWALGEQVFGERWGGMVEQETMKGQNK